MSLTVETRTGPKGEINVTPLIDVLLVLLIIFMVILPHHSLGENALIPQPSPPNPALQPQAPIVIQLKDRGAGERPALKINQAEIKWEELEPKLQAIYRLREERIGFITGDPEIEFAFVAEVLDITRRAGVERVGLTGRND